MNSLPTSVYSLILEDLRPIAPRRSYKTHCMICDKIISTYRPDRQKELCSSCRIKQEKAFIITHFIQKKIKEKIKEKIREKCLYILRHIPIVEIPLDLRLLIVSYI